MDPKPTLSQYFKDSDAPPTSQFFDEISPPSDAMIQSVYLGDNEEFDKQQTKANPLEMDFNLPTISGSAKFGTTNLPDPSTFFDTIESEPQFGASKSLTGPEILAQTIEDLSLKEVDKEAERRRDAWIPNEEAKKTLMKVHSSPKGSFFPEREALTMPGLVMEEELADSLQEAAVKFLGVSEAGSRSVMRQEHVGRDEAGLRELIRSGYLRAAVNLTHTLLDAHGQGVGRMNKPTKHTPRSLQIWLTRFALMIRIRLYESLAAEAESFGDLSKPDMYYQFYPEQYETRTGTLVPFSLRLLIAELPIHTGKAEDAIDRLYDMLDIIEQMLTNLENGKTEDGTSNITLESDKMDSIKLWTGRRMRIEHSIINCAIALKDYRLAIQTLKNLSAYPHISDVVRRGVYSALCRVCLQAGHVKAAFGYMENAKEYRNKICPTPDLREYVDLGLMDISNGKYQDAYNHFLKAADQEPTNIMVANNISVCLLYMGKLKEAISVLQKAINADPQRGLNESLLINLCTMYELESSKTNEKKLNLLRMLCKYKSDTIPNVLECLKLS